jgi:transcriptional regulator with XRE-family HTH domain
VPVKSAPVQWTHASTTDPQSPIGEPAAAIGGEIERLRLDASISRADLARASGVDAGYLLRVERGDHEPSVTTLLALGDSLGADLVVRLYPNTGPRIHDRHQARIAEALLTILHPRWLPTPEVGVTQPVRGSVDLALHDPAERLLVATEIESLLRRLEQVLRWHQDKAAALPSSRLWRFASAEGSPEITRLLVIRSTRANRDIVRDHATLLSAAYPGRAADARASLTGAGRWPGPSIVWADTRASGVRILEGPPRGITLGR